MINTLQKNSENLPFCLQTRTGQMWIQALEVKQKQTQSTKGYKPQICWGGQKQSSKKERAKRQQRDPARGSRNHGYVHNGRKHRHRKQPVSG